MRVRINQLPPAVWFTSSNALPSLLQLLLLPILSRWLGPQEFGLLTLAQACIFLFQVLTGSPLSAYLTRYWQKETATSGILTTTLVYSLILFLFCCLILVLLNLFGVFPLQGLSFQTLLIVLVIAGLTSAETQYLTGLVQEKRPKAYFYRIAFHATLAFAGSLVAIFLLEPNHKSVLAGRALGMTAIILPLALSSALKGKFKPHLLNSIFKFTLPILPYTLLTQALLFSDRWGPGILLNPAQAGYLGLAIAFISLNEMVFQAIRNQVQPDIYEAWNTHNEGLFKSAASLYFRYGFLIYLLSFFPITGLVWLILPDNFQPVVPLLPWIQAAFWFRCLFILKSLPEFYSPQRLTLTYAALFALLMSLVISFGLIPILGVAGGGMAFWGARWILYFWVDKQTRRRSEFYTFQIPVFSWFPFVCFLATGVLLTWNSINPAIAWAISGVGILSGLIWLSGYSIREKPE